VPNIESSCAQGVLRVLINRPAKRNALSRAVLDELRSTFERQASDSSLRVAVLTGAGDKNFAAGGDLKDLGQIRTVEGAAKMSDQAYAALDAIRRFPVPVIAALNGDALGGGAELAVACDLRIAASHARIGFVQGTLNISTAWGGGTDLMRLIGPAKALATLGRAEMLSGAEAVALGLIDAVAEPSETLEALISRFIAPFARQVPQVMRAFKAQTLAERLGLSRTEREKIDREFFAITWAHDDHWTVADKLLSKDKP
jgi:enoyl-CoA hydratase